MIYYKNTSSRSLTFYNVTFGPGDIKPVPDYINRSCMIRCDEPKQTSTKPKAAAEKHASTKSSAAVVDVKLKSDKQIEQGGNANGSDKYF